MKVIILRGIPGSGKSHRCADLAKTFSVRKVSADDYHFVDGKYEFKLENLSKAHHNCFVHYMMRIAHPLNQVGVDILVVDNTNIHAWEVAPYVMAAQAYGSPVEIVTIWCDPAVAVARNIHGVSAEKVFAMHQALLSEKLPAHWPQKMIF